MDELRLDDFSNAVGERFELRAGEETFQLELTDARPGFGNSMRKHGSFNLYWLGPVEPILPQGIYEMRRGDTAYEIFIVPISQDGSGTTYEAVFN